MKFLEECCRNPQWLTNAQVLGGLFLLLQVGCHSKTQESTASSAPPSTSALTSSTSIPQQESQPESGLLFEDTAMAWGVDHTYRDGAESGYFSILESLGGGVGLLDCDHDGLIDLFVPGGGSFEDNGHPAGHVSTLFRQRSGLEKVHFTEVSALAGVSKSVHYSHGSIVSDYDNDGFDDVLVTGYGGVQLFNNLGDGTFQEIATQANLTDALWSSSAAWGDFNGDGATDIFIVHYVDWSPANNPHCLLNDDKTREVCPPRQFSGLPDSLYLSDGAGGFIESSSLLGQVPPGKGLGVVAVDIDLDGDLDVYVTNDTVMNHLYLNESGKQLIESGSVSATGYGDTGREDGSMGVDVGDYNGDGLPDIWVTNYENETFALYRNFNGRFFQHVSRSTGIAAAGGLSVGWGTVFADLDLDGDEDLFAANGHVIRHPVNSPLNQPPLLLLNIEHTRFRNVAQSAGFWMASSHMGRGVAQGDLDQDGDLDLVVSHINQPLAVLRNESTRLGNWIKIELIGVHGTRPAEGARIEFVLVDGRRILRLRKGGTSYASSSSAIVHAGLGRADQIAEIVIYWPGGSVQRFPHVDANQHLLAVEGRPALYKTPQSAEPALQ